LKNVAYNPQNHLRAYSESMHESINEIVEYEVDTKKDGGYEEDEEDEIPQPDPRKRGCFKKFKKQLEVSSSH
jgi:hypothetical protein